MEITLRKEESEKYFYDALCNGLGYMESYGLKLGADKKSYSEARVNLTRENQLNGITDTICYEDVLMQILREGGNLKMIDLENGGEYTSIITLEDVHERVSMTPVERLMEAITGNDDAVTADCIIQTVFYKEVIFG